MQEGSQRLDMQNEAERLRARVAATEPLGFGPLANLEKVMIAQCEWPSFKSNLEQISDYYF